MDSEIVIRAARPQDKEARAELIKRGVTSYDRDAILFFILQELMLQVCVLLGAVLFIFGGASLGGIALVPPAMGVLAALAVLAAHRAQANTQAARMRRERAGFVAAWRGRVVGTVSVSEYRGARRSGWLHGLGVAAAWRRRGVGGALLGAARAHAADARLESLEAAASALQASARSLLHSHGWELRGTYHRQLLGTALTLPMLQMGLELAPT